MQRVIYCINFMIFGCPELHEGDEGCPWVGLDGVGATGGGPAAGAGWTNGGAVAFWRRWSESEWAKGRGGRGGRGEAHRVVHSGGEGPEGGGQRWGRSSACCNNGGRAGGPISGRGRARTARGGAAKLRGEARDVVACGIEVGRRWVDAGGGMAAAQPSSSSSRTKGTEKKGSGSGKDKNAPARQPRFADGRRVVVVARLCRSRHGSVYGRSRGALWICK